MAFKAAGDVSASQNAQDVLSLWQLRRRRQRAARARDKAVVTQKSLSLPPGLSSPRASGAARQPASESSFPAPCGLKLTLEEVSGNIPQEWFPPGVWLPEAAVSSTVTGVDRAISASGGVAIERRLDGVAAALRLFARNIKFSGTAEVSTSVCVDRQNSLLEEVNAAQERMVARI